MATSRQRKRKKPQQPLSVVKKQEAKQANHEDLLIESDENQEVKELTQGELAAAVSEKEPIQKGEKVKLVKETGKTSTDEPKSQFGTIDIPVSRTAKLKAIEDEALQDEIKLKAEYEKQLAALQASVQTKEKGIAETKQKRTLDILEMLISDDEDAVKEGVKIEHLQFVNKEFTYFKVLLPNSTK